MSDQPKDFFNPDQIQWVFFDFDGTLRHNEPGGLDTLHRFVEEDGFVLAEQAVKNAWRWNFRYWADSEMLEADSEAAAGEFEKLYLHYTRRYLQELGVNGDRLDRLAEEMHRRMSEEYDPIDRVSQDAITTLGLLKRAGFPMALISNRRDPFIEKVQELGLETYFEFTLAAGEVGWWKPDPRLLEYAAERAGIRPEQAVYIGDNPYADVEGARAAGMQPILIDPEGLFSTLSCPVIQTLDQLPSLLAIEAG